MAKDNSILAFFPMVFWILGSFTQVINSITWEKGWVAGVLSMTASLVLYILLYIWFLRELKECGEEVKKDGS